MASALGNMILMTDPEAAAKRDEVLRSGRQPQRESPGSPRASCARSVRRVPWRCRWPMGGRACRPALPWATASTAWTTCSRHGPGGSCRATRSRSRSSTSVSAGCWSRWTCSSRTSAEGAHGPRSCYDIDGEYDRWYRATGQQAFIERPDRYVYGTAPTLADLPELVDELGASLARYDWRAAAELVAAA